VHVELTDELEMLRDATRRWAEREQPRALLHDAVLGAVLDPVDFDRAGHRAGWQAAAELGWPAMLVLQRYGGFAEDAGGDDAAEDGGGGGVVGAAVVAEELGRALAPWPLVGVSVVADALTREGSEEQRERLLPGIARGELVATWAVADDDRSWDGTGTAVRAELRGDGSWTVTGRKRAVQDAAAADHLLITAAGPDGPVQLLVAAGAPGVTIEPPARRRGPRRGRARPRRRARIAR
jgi:alkylation response protein AidB-like acyl-CoA dehydrogenase